MSISIRRAIALFAQLISSSAATNVLIVGDSVGSRLEDTFLEELCTGSDVCNAAISGTTAEQWANYGSDKVKKCNDAFDYWDVVYISVGGNDILQSICTITADELGRRLQAAVTNIMDIAPGASKYLLLGYCASPMQSSDYFSCDFAKLSEAFDSLDTEDGLVEVIDSVEVCGGSTTTNSEEKYFSDSIHVNNNGYCMMFSQPEVQTALSCSEITSMDCETLRMIQSESTDSSDQNPGSDENGKSADKSDKNEKSTDTSDQIPESDSSNYTGTDLSGLTPLVTSAECTIPCFAATLKQGESCIYSDIGECSCVSPYDPFCIFKCDEKSGSMKKSCGGTDSSDQISEISESSNGNDITQPTLSTASMTIYSLPLPFIALIMRYFIL